MENLFSLTDAGGHVEELVRDYLPQLADAPRDATRP